MMAGKYDVVISLLVYNQTDVTRECIDSIFDKSRSNFLLVISDNASRKETADYLKSVAALHKNVVYVRNEENLGYIGGHNAAYEKYSPRSDYFCVLNNDVVIKTEGWDKAFLAALSSSPNLAQVGPAQAHGYINAKGIGVRRPVLSMPPEYIGGSCFVAKVEAIGARLFEDRYMKFAFCEDADLSFRLRAAGGAIKEMPGVIVHHKHHTSFKNERIDFDFKEQERANQRFLIDRWQKYMRLRNFNPPLQILVIRTRAIGDAFMADPILRELAHKYPGAHIYIQTACPEWFTPCDYIKECGPNLRAKRRYDIVIDLDMAYERNPKMHVVDAYAKAAMVLLDEDKRTPQYHGATPNKNGKTAVINAEGSWESRQWPLDRITAFAEYLQGQGYRIKEVGRTQALYTGIGENLIGKMKIQEVIQTIADASLYFGMDGGLAHFAQSVGTPSVLIFGCTNPAYRVHDKSVLAIWRGDLPCSGCHHESVRTFTKCKTGDHECLTGITVDHVIKEFEAWV